MSDLGVLDQAVAVGVGRRREAPRAQNRRPRLLHERRVAGGSPVVAVALDVERRRIGAGPRVRIIREPREKRRALGNLVRNLSIAPLKLPQKRERQSRRLAVAIRIDGESRPDRVAPEEPGEARTFALARGAEPRDESGTEQWVGRDAFVDANLCPPVEAIETRV